MKLPRSVLLPLVLILTTGISSAFGQRMEVSGGAAVHRLSRSDSTSAGVTGRFTFDITNWLAAEAEMSFFPNDDITLRTTLPDIDFGLVHERRRTDGFFGAKIGYRGSRYGVFGKVRPGFTSLSSQGYGCEGIDCERIMPLILLAPTSYRTEFALDIGGGFEFFPSRRTVARFEFGDTMIRHRSMAPPCWQETCTSHNFTTRIGGGVRF